MGLITSDIACLCLSISTIYLWEMSPFEAWLCLFLSFNFKMLPIIPTLRVLPSLVRLLLWPSRVPESDLLFKPYSTTSRCCILECDINIHKSNSTFLLDLDISRAELLTRRLTHGLRHTKGALVLAGVDISFRREIRPLQVYDTRSVILAWGSKWIYVLSYHVAPGSVVDARGGADEWLAALCGQGENQDAQAVKRDVFAVAISKYVAKAGKRTISPVKLLEANGFFGSTHGQAEGKATVDAINATCRRGLEFLREHRQGE